MISPDANPADWLAPHPTAKQKIMTQEPQRQLSGLDTLPHSQHQLMVQS